MIIQNVKKIFQSDVKTLNDNNSKSQQFKDQQLLIQYELVQRQEMTNQQKSISCMDKAKNMLTCINPLTWFSKKSTTPTPQPFQPAGPHVLQPSPQTDTHIQPTPQPNTPQQPPKSLKTRQLRFQNKQNSDIPQQNNQDQSKSKQPSDSY